MDGGTRLLAPSMVAAIWFETAPADATKFPLAVDEIALYLFPSKAVYFLAELLIYGCYCWLPLLAAPVSTLRCGPVTVVIFVCLNCYYCLFDGYSAYLYYSMFAMYADFFLVFF